LVYEDESNTVVGIDKGDMEYDIKSLTFDVESKQDGPFEVELKSIEVIKCFTMFYYVLSYFIMIY